MDEIKNAAAIVGQLGLPIVLVLYWIFRDRPNQQAREDKIRGDFAQLLRDALTEERNNEDTKRKEDKSHALELQKLAGDIHLRANTELVTSIGNNTKEVQQMMGKLDRAIETFLNGGKR